jgi:hypothetical protein
MKLIEIRDQHIECESPSPGNRDHRPKPHAS